jgi:MinD superfamily P-loop ATPase
MPEILVISGKGGTGKTSLTGAFAQVARNPVICDLDVDAPDLHLLLQPQPERTEDFYSGNQAVIDQALCTDCGLCQEMCRYQAIARQEQGLAVDGRRCEGCKVCVHFCPAQAISFPIKHRGRWFISQTRLGPMVHAQLFPGQENSGRLVALLRQQAKELAKSQGRDLILCDGTPGIGCPVISSLSGVDLAVLVTEPTPSGRHDMERVLELCGHFRVQAAVVINKHDLNEGQSGLIERYCAQMALPLLAKLPHDPVVTQAMLAAQVVTEYSQYGFSDLIRGAWQAIETLVRHKRAV